eukprot:TRINITY_DN6788_c0_g1_i1.p1 TRINITY_DN6788_c0_g1~~TRINITY_DN6788_c0_g1_i1.p1  ORF type:complete len:559 (+),score=90.03 TRINITY_DN6788_c0_g1_i1:375-2051(+)
MALECHEGWKKTCITADNIEDDKIVPLSYSPISSVPLPADGVGAGFKVTNTLQNSDLAESHTDQNNHCPFLELPPELISNILNRLDAKELSIVSCVCIVFWNLSSNSHGWKDLYCERWGLPILQRPSDQSAFLAPEKPWRQLYVEREACSKAFLGRFKVDTLHGHTEPIRSVCLLPHANLIFSAGYDTVVRMWNMEEGFMIDQSRPLGSTIRAIAVDSEMLIVGGTEAFVLGWRAVPNCRKLFNISGTTATSNEFRLRGHLGPVTCLGLDASNIYSGSWDMSICIWDRSTLRCLKAVWHGDWVWSLVVRGSYLMSTSGSDLYIWDVKTRELLTVKQDAHKGNAYAVQCSRSGHLVFTGGEDGAIHMFENKPLDKQKHHKSHRPVASWIPHTSPVYSLAFEDPWLVSASGDGRLGMMDVRKLLKSNANVNSGSNTKGGIRWRNSNVLGMQNVEPPQRMLHGFYRNLFSVDITAERVVCGGEEGVLRIWDFTRALEIERTVQASRNLRLENRSRRKKANGAVKTRTKQVEAYSIMTQSCETHDKRNRIWQSNYESSEVQA